LKKLGCTDERRSTIVEGFLVSAYADEFWITGRTSRRFTSIPLQEVFRTNTTAHQANIPGGASFHPPLRTSYGDDAFCTPNVHP
jgi:hypothetical protein